MKRLLAWTGSANSTITSEAVMAMAEKFNTGQEVCLQIPSARGVTHGPCAHQSEWNLKLFADEATANDPSHNSVRPPMERRPSLQ